MEQDSEDNLQELADERLQEVTGGSRLPNDIVDKGQRRLTVLAGHLPPPQRQILAPVSDALANAQRRQNILGGHISPQFGIGAPKARL
jgi:hypothetical protein